MEQKTTWTLLLAFGIASSLLLQACEGNDGYAHLSTLRYVNETSHTIEIKKWRKNVETTHKLEPLGELKFKHRLPTGLCYINGIIQNDNRCTFASSDSLRIIFDGSKSYLLKHPGLGGKRISVNILDFINNYTSTNNHCNYKTCEHLEYRFTEKDYQYAK